MTNKEIMFDVLDRISQKYEYELVFYDNEPIEDDDFSCHFHIKKCKNWLFGLWVYGNNEDSTKIKVDFFCQYEKYIDKFKPTRSNYCKTLVYYKTGENTWSDIDYWGDMEYVYDIIKFIHKHSIKAWNVDQMDYDYNTMYVSNVKLFWNRIKIGFNVTKYTSLQNFCDKTMIRYIEKKILPILTEVGFENIRIHKHKHIFPSYQILAGDIGENTYYENTYTLEFEPSEESDGRELINKWNTKEEKIKKMAKLLGVCWYSPIDQTIEVRRSKNEQNS